MRYLTLRDRGPCVGTARRRGHKDDPQVMSTINTFMAAFNKGDMAGRPRRRRMPQDADL